MPHTTKTSLFLSLPATRFPLVPWACIQSPCSSSNVCFITSALPPGALCPHVSTPHTSLPLLRISWVPPSQSGLPWQPFLKQDSPQQPSHSRFYLLCLISTSPNYNLINEGRGFCLTIFFSAVSWGMEQSSALRRLLETDTSGQDWWYEKQELLSCTAVQEAVARYALPHPTFISVLIYADYLCLKTVA